MLTCLLRRRRLKPRLLLLHLTSAEAVTLWSSSGEDEVEGSSVVVVAAYTDNSKMLSCRREAARRFVSLNISPNHSRSLEINNTVYLSPSNKSLATNGHSNTVTRVSLECCTQTARSDGTVFITPDGRTVDNTRKSEIMVEIAVFLIPHLHLTSCYGGPRQNTAIKSRMNKLHCVSKNAPTLTSYNSFDKHRLILVIFGKRHQHTFRNDACSTFLVPTLSLTLFSFK